MFVTMGVMNGSEHERCEAVRVGCFLPQLAVHSVYGHLEEEAHQMLVSVLCAYHAQCSYVFVAPYGSR